MVILSHRLWQSRFGADPGILGRKLTLNGKPCTVIGVLPAHGPFDRSYAQLWMPLAFEPHDMTRDYHWFMSYGATETGSDAGEGASANEHHRRAHRRCLSPIE